jgi:hypothetical protein
MISTPLEVMHSLAETLERDGFAFARNAISLHLVEELRAICAEARSGPSVARRGNSVYGIRNLLTTVPEIRRIVCQSPFIDGPLRVLGQQAQPVMGVFFDKTPEANWPIPWHQDVTIRVRQRIETPGFEPRPVKDGQVHMLPPVGISEQILAIRIHMDDATSKHGALRVVPGSHRRGRLSNEEILQSHTEDAAVTCEAFTGDVMLMRPLLLHASSVCEQPGHRRVIQIEYAAFQLPGELEWHG